MSKLSSHKGDIMLLLASMSGGIGFVFIKYLLEQEFTPFQIIAGRFFVAVLLLCLLYHKEYRKITLQEWKYGGILGGFLFLLFALLIMGLQYTTPSVNAFLSSLHAVIVPFLLWGIFRTKPNWICFVAAAITMMGVAFISGADGIDKGIGVILSLGASVVFAFQMTLMDQFLNKYCADGLHLALVEHITVFVLALIITALQKQAVPTITVYAVKYFMLLGVICTAAYFVLQSLGQKYTDPSKSAIILTLECVFALIAGAVLYGERLVLRGYIGCIMIFFALILTEIKPTKNNS